MRRQARRIAGRREDADDLQRARGNAVDDAEGELEENSASHTWVKGRSCLRESTKTVDHDVNLVDKRSTEAWSKRLVLNRVALDCGKRSWSNGNRYQSPRSSPTLADSHDSQRTVPASIAHRLSLTSASCSSVSGAVSLRTLSARS